MYFKEFPVMFDWMHNGEGFSAFFLQGLSDPQDPAFALRTRRYAGLYMGDDPAAPNYDPEHRIIRSMFNGSRGPLMRKATGLDWAGDPIEIEGRFDPGHGERNYEEMLVHFQDYNDVVGDHPLNMGTTTLAFNAYALTGERRYVDWLVGYVDAWVERTEANGGITPSNVGLDGTIGGACDGKWYGGVYGWGFSVYNPATGKIQHRPAMMGRAPWSFGNGLLVTGDFRYVDTWRGVIDAVNANAKVVDGRKVYPRMHGDEGWYDFRDEPFDDGVMEVYYWTLDPSDRERVTDSGWLDFLDGRNPGYPVAALEATLEAVRMRIEGVRQDTASPDTRMSDDMNGLTPALTDSLTELMLGGLPPGRQGHPLHSRVRYFRSRARPRWGPGGRCRPGHADDDNGNDADAGEREPGRGADGDRAGRGLRRAPDRHRNREWDDGGRGRPVIRSLPGAWSGRRGDAHNAPLRQPANPVVPLGGVRAA